MSDIGSSGPSSALTGGGNSRGEPLPFAVVSDRGVEIVIPPGLGLFAEAVETEGRILVSAGAAGKSNAQVFEFPAGYCVAWIEHGAEGTFIKLSGLSREGRPFGSELTIGAAGFENHSLSVSGFGWQPPSGASHENSSAEPGLTVAWVAASEPGSLFGRIVLQRFSVELDEDGNPRGFAQLPAAQAHQIEPPSPALPEVEHGSANDNILEIAPLGSAPALKCLYWGDTFVAWVGSDEQVHGRLLSSPHSTESLPEAGDVRGDFAALNGSLGDFGPISGSEATDRRLQLLDLGSGSVALMWIALASSGLELRGSLLSFNNGATDEPVAVSDVSPIKLTNGFNGKFILGLGPGKDPVVVYVTEDGEEVVHSLSVGSSTGEEARATHQVAEIIGFPQSGPAGEPSPDLSDRHYGNVDQSALSAAMSRGEAGAQAGHGHSSEPAAIGASAEISADSVAASRVSASTAPSLTILSIAGTPGDDGVRETSPIVTSTAIGAATAFQIDNGDGRTVTLKVVLQDSAQLSGSSEASASAPVEFVVTETADAKVAPDIAGVANGAGVAWVESSEAGSSLVIETVTHDGKSSGAVVVASSECGSISGIDLVGQTIGDSIAPGYDQQLAAVWVESSNSSLYGTINVQRFAVNSPSEGDAQALVALGADGTPEGNNDPVTLTYADGSLVEGRDPKAAGLSDGDLAVIWVDECNPEEGDETIEGVVITQSSGTQDFRLNLTELMPGGVAKGTKPVLIAGPDGDLLVFWIEKGASKSDGYALKVAIYDMADSGSWIEPAAAIELRHFQEEVDYFSVTLAGTSQPELFVTWREDDSDKDLYGQRYSLDGQALAAPLEITKSSKSGTDTFGTAGLVDGKIMVVYTEQDGRDVDVKASVFDFSSSTSADPTSTSKEISEKYGYTNTAPQDLSLVPDSQSLPASEPAQDNSLAESVSASTTQGEPLILDPIEFGAGLRISAVNGIPIGPAEAVDVGSGYVQLRDDGKLLFSPDVGFTGTASFSYTLTDEAGLATVRSDLSVEVLPSDSAGALFEEDFEFAYENLIAQGDEAQSGSSQFEPLLESDHEVADGPQLSSILAGYDHDTLVFKPGFGSDVITGFGASGEHHPVIDISSYGYATFEALKEAGALIQDGDDVVIMLTPSDPAVSDKITLKSYNVSLLVQDDFKLS
jgi:hypothetical protein